MDLVILKNPNYKYATLSANKYLSVKKEHVLQFGMETGKKYQVAVAKGEEREKGVFFILESTDGDAEVKVMKNRVSRYISLAGFVEQIEIEMPCKLRVEEIEVESQKLIKFTPISKKN